MGNFFLCAVLDLLHLIFTTALNKFINLFYGFQYEFWAYFY